MIRTTRTSRLAALAIAVPLLAGCGASASTPTASSGEAAPAAAGDRVAAVAEREADGEALVAKLRTALESLDTGRFELDLTGRMSMSASGSYDVTGAAPSLSVTPETALLGISEVRVVEGEAFVRSGTGWLRLDLQQLLAGLPLDRGAGSGLDADGLADALAGSISDVEVSGDTGEEVWRGSVDPSEVLAALPQLPGLPGLPPSAGAEGREIPDADLTATFTGDRLDALVVGQGDAGSVELTLSEQGEPVDITAPPADQVQDLGDLGDLLGGLGAPGGLEG